MAPPANRLDPRLHAYRDDLADAELRGRVAASDFVEGETGRIVVGRVPVRRRPASDAPIDTFYHYGEPVMVFERREGWAWCQSMLDLYVGFVAESAVTEPPAAAPSHYIATRGSYCYAAPDLRGEAVDFLPRHSPVVVEQSALKTRGTDYARLDTGAFLPLACLSPEPPGSADLVTAAELYLGSPYLWGGKSLLGLDCSGLVQNAFRDLGILVLRDTDMQRDTIGAAVPASGEADLQPGDLIYMPGHVVIHAGAGAIVHADGGSMMVRRETFAGFMHRTGLGFPDFTVRRPSA